MVDEASFVIRADTRDLDSAKKKLDDVKNTGSRAEKNLSSSMGRVTSSFRAVAGAAAAIGVSLSAISAGRAIIDAAIQSERLQNTLTAATGSAAKAAKEIGFLRDISQDLGLNFRVTSEQFAKFAAATRGTALEGQATRDALVGIAQATTTLGLSADQAGGVLTAFQQIVSKNKVSTEELLQIAERVPGTFNLVQKALNLTGEELSDMLRAGELLADDLIPALSREFTNAFGGQSLAAAEGLNAQLNRMDNAFNELAVAVGQTGIIDFFNDAIKGATEFLNVLTGTISTADQTAVQRQIELIDDLKEELADMEDLKNIPLGDIFLFDKRKADELAESIQNAESDLEALQQREEESAAAAKKAAEAEEELADAITASSNSADNAVAPTTALADAREREAEAAEKAQQAERQREDVLNEVNRIINMTSTAQERYNAELDSLNAILATGQLDYDIYTRRVQQLDEELEAASGTVEVVTQELDQFSLQAARNMQSAFGDIFFDVFEGRTENMVDTFTSAMKRMAAEAVSADLLNAVFNTGSGGNIRGLLGAFGIGGSSGGGLFGGGGATSTVNIASAGGAFNNLPGLLGGSSTRIGGPSSFGASLSSAAGPILAGAAVGLVVDSLLDSIVGDLSTGSSFLNKVPVIGEIASGLFGRGPLEIKDARLLGDITIEGFEGVTNTRARADGGVFRSDRTDNIIVNVDSGELLNAFKGLRESGVSSELSSQVASAQEQALQIGQFLDTTLQNFNQSLQQTADVLGLSISSLEGFSREIDIVTAKGESLTFDQITEALSDVGDHMANILLPGLQGMVRDGETATQALNRFAGEFASLENALVVFGVSAEQAKSAISALSIATRTELVDAAGGAEALNAQIAFFATNFLTAEQQLEIAFNALDEQMQTLGFSANLSRDEFTTLVQSVTQIGGISTEVAAELLRLAPAFDQVKNMEAAVAAQSDVTSAALGGLESAIGGVGRGASVAAESTRGFANAVDNVALSGRGAARSFDALASATRGSALSAAEMAQGVQDSFARIDAARAGVEEANLNMATQQARSVLSGAQSDLAAANQALSVARSNLSAAQSAEQQRSNAARQQSANAARNAEQQRLRQLRENEAAEARRLSDEINKTISDRAELINSYQQEAGALRGMADRFTSLSRRILDFNDSLVLSDLSPLSPGDQLAFARQQFNATRARAAAGDEDALADLPDVSRDFLEASKTFNGATAAFESDFNLVRQVLEVNGITARETGELAAQQLEGIEGTIEELQVLNEQSREIARELGRVNSSIGNTNSGISDVNSGLGTVAGNTLTIGQATADLAAAQARVEAAQNAVGAATNSVEDAIFNQNGFIDDVGLATIQVRDAVRELNASVLQGPGNAGISDQQIRNFVRQNPNLTDEQFLNEAVNAGISQQQLVRALQPLGVTEDRVNRASQGAGVTGQQISDFVDANINNPFAIYNAAVSNGISSQQLANNSRLSLEEINRFVRDNNLQPFVRGTDMITRTGPIFAHRGEAVLPSSVPDEIIKLREEFAKLREGFRDQMITLIDTNIEVNRENARMIAKSNDKLATSANWRERIRSKVG